MPGRVVRLSVAVGDIVAPGAVVAVLEAMKMENDVRSVGGGRVTAVVVQEGVAVESGALLVQLEPIGVE
jgi:biotin carboxyl carrier protein